jgi:uncharacterized membrane protein YhaH (DUF805 family)
MQLYGAGAACFALGSLTWSYIEVVHRVEVPFPGAPDVFYVLQYVPLTIACWWALAVYVPRDRWPSFLGGSGTFLALVGVGLWFSVSDALLDPAVPVLQRALSAAYPYADLILLLWPTLALLVALVRDRELGDDRPWWWVLAGIAVLTASDVLFTIETWNQSYESGNWLDVGWIVAFLLLAVGGSLVVDFAVHEERTKHTAEP